MLNSLLIYIFAAAQNANSCKPHLTRSARFTWIGKSIWEGKSLIGRGRWGGKRGGRAQRGGRVAKCQNIF